MDGPAIELREVKHSSGDEAVLHGIDLTIEPGEIFGFLGHNGAGKTTAMNILTTLIEPTSGVSLADLKRGNAMMSCPRRALTRGTKESRAELIGQHR